MNPHSNPAPHPLNEGNSPAAARPAAETTGSASVSAANSLRARVGRLLLWFIAAARSDQPVVSKAAENRRRLHVEIEESRRRRADAAESIPAADLDLLVWCFLTDSVSAIDLSVAKYPSQRLNGELGLVMAKRMQALAGVSVGSIGILTALANEFYDELIAELAPSFGAAPAAPRQGLDPRARDRDAHLKVAAELASIKQAAAARDRTQALEEFRQHLFSDGISVDPSSPPQA